MKSLLFDKTYQQEKQPRHIFKEAPNRHTENYQKILLISQSITTD